MSEHVGEALAKELPAGWAWATLEDVAEINPKANLDGLPRDFDVSFVRMGAVEEETGRLDPSDIRRLGDVAKGYTRFKEGDVLFAKITPCMENGKIALATNLSNGMGFGSTEFHVLRPQEGMEAKYLLHFLLQPSFRGYAEHYMKGTAGQKRVPPDILREARIPVPPTMEQRRIVEKIDALLSDVANGVESLDAVDRKLATYRESVLKAAVTGKLRLGVSRTKGSGTARALLGSLTEERAERATKPATEPDLTYGWSIPAHWEWASLDLISWDTSYGSSKKCEPNGSGIPVLRIPNVRSGVIVRADIKRFREEVPTETSECLQPGDLLVIRTNGSEDLIGRGAVIPDNSPEPEFFASYLVRFRLVGGTLIHRWVNLVWQTPMLRQMVLAKGASSAGQYNLSQSKLRPFPIPIPPRAEISQIVEKVDEVLSAISAADTASGPARRRASSLRRSILNTAFTGRLVPQNPEDEPACELLARIRERRAQVPTTSGRRGRPRHSERATV